MNKIYCTQPGSFTTLVELNSKLRCSTICIVLHLSDYKTFRRMPSAPTPGEKEKASPCENPSFPAAIFSLCSFITNCSTNITDGESILPYWSSTSHEYLHCSSVSPRPFCASSMMRRPPG